MLFPPLSERNRPLLQPSSEGNPLGYLQIASLTIWATSRLRVLLRLSPLQIGQRPVQQRITLRPCKSGMITPAQALEAPHHTTTSSDHRLRLRRDALCTPELTCTIVHSARAPEYTRTTLRRPDDHHTARLTTSPPPPTMCARPSGRRHPHPPFGSPSSSRLDVDGQ